MREGAHVAIHYRGSEHGARQTAIEGETMGSRVALLQADLSDVSAARGLAGRAAEALGGLEVLVNSAAIMERGTVSEATPDDWDRTMNLNLRGAFFVAQGAAAAMKDGGAIVNIADLAAFERWASYAVHCISKAGVVAITRALALEVRDAGVRVNAVAPGTVRTHDKRASISGAGVHWVEISELVNAVMFLASDLSAGVTGHVLPVSHGES